MSLLASKVNIFAELSSLLRRETPIGITRKVIRKTIKKNNKEGNREKL